MGQADRLYGLVVKDVAAHILGVDLGNLSMRRDGFWGAAPEPGEELAAFVNHFNEEWVRAARRLSPRVLIDLLGAVGPPLFTHFRSLDPSAQGGSVSWAGSERAPVWLDVAREYTERWVHQQQIRDAVGKPGLADRRFLALVLATFVQSLPVAFHDTDAPNRASVQLHLRGESGGDWSVVREAGGWVLYAGAPAAPDPRVSLNEAPAWRMFTRGIVPREAE